MARAKAAKKKKAPAKTKASSKPKGKAKARQDEAVTEDVDELSDVGNSSWEVEELGLTLEKLRTKVAWHTSISSEVGEENVTFKRGDKIWIAPAPSPATVKSLKGKVDNLEDVPDEFWDVAEILDCCSLRTDDDHGTTVGFLRVKWFYQLTECLALPTLHAGFKKRLKDYKFDKDERVDTDHVDFISLEAYAGSAEGIWCYLSISGLEISDEDRLKPAHKRAPPTKKVRAQGFSLKDAAIRQERREEWEKAAEKKAAEKLKKKKEKEGKDPKKAKKAK